MVRANHASGLDDARARIHQITGTQSDALFSVLKLEKPLALFAATPDPIVLLPALLNTLRDQTATVTLSSHHPHLRPIWQEKFADIDNLTISEAPWGNGKETIYYELKGQSLSLLRAPNPVYETWLYGYSDWMQPLLEKPVKTRSLKTDRGDGQMDALFLGHAGQ